MKKNSFLFYFELLIDGPRRATTFSVLVDDNGVLTDWSVKPTMLDNVKRITYEQAAAAIEGDNSVELDEDERADLKQMFQMAQSRHKYRVRECQALDFDLPSVKNLLHIEIFFSKPF